MANGFRLFLALIISVFAINSAQAQFYNYNPLYEPPPKYRPLKLVKRLSYENFKHIKLLQSSIANYGGGDAEVQALVDQYADASALYFQNRINDAANMFTKNEKKIFETSKKLSKIYKEDSEKLMTQALKINIKRKLRRSLDGKKPDPVAEKLLANAQFGIQKANDFYDRFGNAKEASPRGLISAIYYFRRAKENIFLIYEARYIGDKSYRFKNSEDKVKFIKKAIDEDKALSANEKSILKQLYNSKAVMDNDNKIFKSMEKMN